MSEFRNPLHRRKLKSHNLPLKHYSKPEVSREIIDFCRNRWVAVHCVHPSGKLIFRRYRDRVHPLKISSTLEFRSLIEGFQQCQVRSIYASIAVYRKLERVDDAYDLSLMASITPTWDIDSSLAYWREVVAIAREIISFLEKHGVASSVFIKWSGNGCHVHIHEGAFSSDILEKHHPLDLAYAIVEYTNLKLASKFVELSPNGKTVVENKIDPARVFTVPLSLHRELDVVCICMKPNHLDSFTPSWVDPENFKHDPSWRRFVEGEADELAEKAYETIGGYPILKERRRKRKHPPLDEQIKKWLEKFNG